MTSKYYLSPELKEYYNKELKLLIEESEIDEGIVEHLLKLNTNPNISSIFSKKFQLDDDCSLKAETDSYLEFAYTQQLEEVILQSLPNFAESINAKYEIINPKKNPFYPNGKASKFGYRHNPDYFNLKIIKVRFESDLTSLHNEFWEKITAFLTSLSPK